MEHSYIKRCVMMAAWLVTSINAINMLTGMYDYNLLVYLGSMMPSLVMPMMWIIGVSGLLSLVAFGKSVMMGCSGCGSCPCECGECKCE